MTRRSQDRDIRFLKATIPLRRHHGDERALVLEHGDLGYFGDVAIAPSKPSAITFLPHPACAVIDCLQSFAPDSPVEEEEFETSVPVRGPTVADARSAALALDEIACPKRQRERIVLPC